MAKRPADISGDPDIETILHRLNGSDPGVAWAAFIDRYSARIMRIVRQFEFEQDRSQDCFLHVCEKLCEKGFRRLLKFSTTGPASFRTWLGSVVYNLCVDWHRSEYGRAVLLPAISAMPMFDQAVYRLYFERGMEREICRRMLKEEFPDLTREQFTEAIARVHQALTPRQRWKLSLHSRARRPPDTSLPEAHQLPHQALEPHSEASRNERQQLVRTALATLPERQRLLLSLRYEQGLTLRKIAELMDVPDPYRARREIQAALDTLAAAMPVADLKRF